MTNIVGAETKPQVEKGEEPPPSREKQDWLFFLCVGRVRARVIVRVKGENQG